MFYHGRYLSFQITQSVPVKLRVCETSVSRKSAAIGVRHRNLRCTYFCQGKQLVRQPHFLHATDGENGNSFINRRYIQMRQQERGYELNGFVYLKARLKILFHCKKTGAHITEHRIFPVIAGFQKCSLQFL